MEEAPRPRHQKILDLHTRQMRLPKEDFLIVRPSRIVPGQLVVPPDLGDRQAVPLHPFGDGKGWTHPKKGYVNLFSIPSDDEASPLSLTFMLVEETDQDYLLVLLTADCVGPSEVKKQATKIVLPS